MSVDARDFGSAGADAEHRSTDRLIRTFARFVGTGYLVYLALLTPDIVRSMRVVHGWWTPVTVVVVFGSGLVFGLVSFQKNIRTLRIAGSVAALSFLLMALLWWTAWDGVTFDERGGFLAAFPGLASLAAATVWRPLPVFAHMIACVLVVQFSNVAVRQPFPTSNLVAEICFAMMFCTVFVAATLASLRTARILDATMSATHADAASAAAAIARDVERERFDALIHDDVMSSLLAVARQGRTPALARQARAALAHLDALHTHTAADAFAVDEAVAHLRSAATTVDDALDVTVLADYPNSPGDPNYPADAVRAIAAALAEAVRNSEIHARATARSVVVRHSPTSIRVSVHDNGIGFDARSVPPHRLGVAVSIEGRMRQLVGGSARIESTVGSGTTVHLSWRAPDAHPGVASGSGVRSSGVRSGGVPL